MKSVIVEGGAVTAAVSASYPLGSPYIDAPDEVEPGWLFDGQAFSAPPPAGPEFRTRLSRLEFRNRFTASEKQALYTAAETSVDIRIYLDDVNAADFIDTTDPATVAGLSALVAGGLLTQTRADEILQGIEV